MFNKSSGKKSKVKCFTWRPDTRHHFPEMLVAQWEINSTARGCELALQTKHYIPTPLPPTMPSTPAQHEAQNLRGLLPGRKQKNYQ